VKADYIGDANDHLKGQLHQVLRAEGAVRNLYAIPMITSDVSTEWTPEHTATYARLLGLRGVEHVVPQLPFEASRRRAYFHDAVRGIPQGSDVLVDPNTGIREQHAGRAHVLVSELALLLRPDPSRLLIVYDESRDRRELKHKHVERLGGVLASVLGTTIAYEAGRSLTVFVVGPDSVRLERCRATLAQLLGPMSTTRLHAFAAACA
jgi:hypothetical protein